MKKFILLLSIFLFISCGTFNRYNLTDETDDKNFLKEEIQRIYENKEISSTTPLIVIDGKPYRFDVELKEEMLPISKDDISKIDVLKKEPGIALYGNHADQGVLIITTKKYSPKSDKKKDGIPDNIFVSLDGDEVEKEYLNSINPDDIYEITVLKDSLILKQFHPNHNYIGSIQIETYIYRTNKYRQKLSLISNDYRNLIQNISHQEEYSKINYTLNDTLLVPNKNRIKKLLDLDFLNNVEVNVTTHESSKAEVKLTTN